MQIIDIFLLIIMAWGGYHGFKKGLIFEIFSVSALVLAALGSVRLLDKIIVLCVKWYQAQSELLPYIVSVSLFVIILIAITWVGRLLRAFLKPTLLGSLDRFLGSVLGIFKWSICSSALLWLGSLVQLKVPAAYTEDTFIFPIVESLLPYLLSQCVPWIPYIQEWLTTTTTLQDNPL